MSVRTAVELLGLEQPMLLVLDESGWEYCLQAGGTACMRPQAVGYLVPLPPQERLNERLFDATFDLVGLSATEADRLDRIIAGIQGLAGVVVDRTMLNASMEAWVFLQGAPMNRLLGAGMSGVLIWPNSD